MTPATEARYHRERAGGTPAKYALQVARFVTAERPYEWRPDRQGRDSATVERDGFTVRVRVQPDEGMTLDDDVGYGAFVDTREPGAVRARHDWHNERDWYVPAQAIDESITYERKAGASRAVARERAIARAEAEMLDALYVSVYVVTATAYRAGVELGSASVGGVTILDDDRYLDEVADDLIPEAIAEAQDALARLCPAR